MTVDLSGQDLAYWVARANMRGSRYERDILRRHYGNGTPKHERCDEPSMRAFVHEKLGDTLPPRVEWQ